MTPILIIAGLLVVSVGWNYFASKRSGRPWWNPLWMAFTLTAVALLYLVAGLLGYDVPRHNPFIEKPAIWVGHVVWPQVAWASTALLLSGFFWWRGLRRL
jgi:phosphatidylglycerophosphate synthase